MQSFGRDLRKLTSGDHRISEIHKQLAYLKWRRTQVESKIRSIVDSNERAAKECNETMSQSEVDAKKMWVEGIVDDELRAPLVYLQQGKFGGI